jgi:hypothetical protein
MVRNLNDFFGSRFFKAEDFPAPRLLRITEVATAMVGFPPEEKLVVSFHGEEQLLILNKTNGAAIAEIANSTDLDTWENSQVVLFATSTDFGGKTVPCIRVRGPRQRTKPAPATPANPAPRPSSTAAAEHQLRADAGVADDDDDDCPF